MLRVTLFGVLALVACSSGDVSDEGTSDEGGDPSPTEKACKATEAVIGGKCQADRARRFEPKEPLDSNNVVQYGAAPKTLNLPPPPRSGFRLVVPAKKLAPGEETEGCVAWQYPKLENEFVYAARVYTNGALHHSNMLGIAIPKNEQASPYPKCGPGRSDTFSAVSAGLVTGAIPDVLFANSTQIAGGEGAIFPDGTAFRLATAGREVVSSIHWLNTTGEEVVSEVVYDFFTVDEKRVEKEIVPFVYENRIIDVPAGTTGKVEMTCDLFGGNVVSLMPHAHIRTKEVAVDLIREDGTEERVFEVPGFDSESKIEVFDPPIRLDDFAKIRPRCTIENNLEKPIGWGIGTNEMCTLFGYLWPPRNQQLGMRLPGTEKCSALNVGPKRK